MHRYNGFSVTENEGSWHPITKLLDVRGIGKLIGTIDNEDHHAYISDLLQIGDEFWLVTIKATSLEMWNITKRWKP